MEPLVALSFAIRLVALAWSLVLLRRHRDRRLGLSSALLTLMVLSQALPAWPGGLARSAIAWLEFAVSLSALAAVGLLGRTLSAPARRQSQLHAGATLAFHASPEAIVVSTHPEGGIVEVNEGFTRLFGYEREEAIGRTARELDLWAVPADRDRLLAGLRERGQVRDLDFSYRHRCGEIRPCSFSGKLQEVEGKPILVSVIHDVTERRRAEEALRVSEERFAKAFRSSPDAILISSLEKGRIVEINESFTRLSGYSREEAVGRTVRELNMWVDPQKRSQLVQPLRERGRIRDLEVGYRTKSGTERTCRLSAEIIDLDGEPHSLMVARDISDQLRAEAEREAFVQALEAKNAELERFTYTVSHDLKSPLVTIKGFLGLLLKDAAAGDAERLQRDAERIEAATTTMGRLLDELLELSRVGRVVNPPEEVAFADLAREAVAMVAAQIAERGVEVEITPGTPVVVGDRVRLVEVLQNLIENAVKFMGKQAAPRVEIGMKREERVFYVRDNGIGIDSRYLDKVFELFERLDSGIEGTGIGLALVRRIVEVHGGRIWVESEGQGRGSTFCFTVPGPPAPQSKQLERPAEE